MSEKIAWIEPNWPAPNNVKALTTLRRGGVSLAPYNGFNIAQHVGDEAQHVEHNRQALTEVLSLPNEPIWLDQVHSTVVLNANKIDSASSNTADGIVSERAHVVCAVMTADCLPLLLTNKQGSKVAAIHVGWRGLADGIIEQALVSLSEEPKDVIAWSGPCISQSKFEIGWEVKQTIGGSEQHYRASKEEGKFFADLYKLTDERLHNLGITQHSWGDYCTYAQADQFFSFRRDGQTGRMASLIWFE